LEKLDEFGRAVARLGRDVKSPIPRSKLHDLLAAALDEQPNRAARLARELFARCRPDQRSALWEAVEHVGTITEFPWIAPEDGRKDGRRTPLADLVELVDLLPPEGDANMDADARVED
jgi:hypothetical protein